ncbi:MAG: hypothetical protein LPK14_02605 [Hymenobacteraceae bacterium]|nr:hypothetical protein [Hymenobacteraceae bacterium]
MLRRYLSTPLFVLLILGACSTPESLQGFDSETWKADRYGCEGGRQAMVDEFEGIRRELYGKKEYVIRNVLGKPDSEELLERNQRIYYYYIEPGTQCTERNRLSEANRVEVRINPTGKVSEVTYKAPVTTAQPG